MDLNLVVQYSQIEPLTTVCGGLRWRSARHDIMDACRGRGNIIYDPDAPRNPEPSLPEPGAVLAPRILSVPPPEARAGVEYVYQARAFDGIADGFNWSVSEGPVGMIVDRHSGKVTWTPAEGGYVDIVLCALSVYGAKARQGWTICVRKAAAARAFVPNPRFREALRRKNGRIGPLPLRFHSVWRTPVNPACAQCRPTGPPAARVRAALPLRV